MKQITAGAVVFLFRLFSISSIVIPPLLPGILVGDAFL